MIKYYLESNLMAASPSSHLDSLYADLQMHALNVSDGLTKVLPTLGYGSFTTGGQAHAWGWYRVGTEVFWPATPPPIASNHAFGCELQRHIKAGRGLRGVVSGPQKPRIAIPSRYIDLF